MGALRKTVNDPQVRRVFEIACHKVEYVDELQAVRKRRLNTRSECIADSQRAFALAQRRGLIKLRLPARAAAFGLHVLIDGLIQNWMLDPKGFDLLKLGQQTLDTYLAGLAAPETASAQPKPVKRRVAARRMPAG